MFANYQLFQNQLGKDAKLGVSFSLLDKDGLQIKKDGFNEKSAMPMASTLKIGVALAVLKRVYFDRSLNLDAEINFNNMDFSPGPPWNTLDRYFFLPWGVKVTKTVDELLTIMLSESDNTATDKLLNLLGGPSSVNCLMNELGITGYNLTSNVRKLLSDFYSFNSDKSLFNICQVLWEFLSAYKMRVTEKSLYTNQQNTCTPECMHDLVMLLIIESERNAPTWLSQSARILCDKMQLCTTGSNLIRAGTSLYSSFINKIGDKSGSMGGVLNDVAFIQFNNGQWMIFSIYTCLSPQERQVREKIISDITKEILLRNFECKLELEDQASIPLLPGYKRI